MSIVSYTWRGPQFYKHVRHEIVLRLRVVTQLLEAEVVNSIRQPYPPASTEGNPPHTRRFQQGLLGSIFSEVDERGLEGYTGSTMKHSLWLELGTSNMGARPFLRPALMRMLNRIRMIMTKPMPGA